MEHNGDELPKAVPRASKLCRPHPYRGPWVQYPAQFPGDWCW